MLRLQMDGFELAERMRAVDRTRHIPIIFVTAGGNDRRREFRGYEVGAVDFLFKPIDASLLRHKVATFVELDRQRQELHEMLRLHEMFVAAISHDLRQPLSAVVMGTSVLRQDLEGTPSHGLVERIRSSAQRMTSMLDELYDLARARLDGGLSLDRRELELEPVIDRVVRELRVVHTTRAVNVQIDASVGGGNWDESRLGQLLANLLGNALRHGTPEVHVTVRAVGTPSKVTIEVANGGHIPDDIRPRIFDPFRGGTRTSRDSLGLGLYIVRQIVRAHGGDIEVESSPESGVVFRVQLPRRVEIGAGGQASERSARTSN